MTDTVRAASLRGYVELVGQLGGNGSALLAAHGLAANLNDEEVLIPAVRVAKLLETTAATLGCFDFGLKLARVQDIGVLGPIAIAIQNSRTLKEALDVVSSYMFVHHDGMSISPVAHTADPGRIALCYEFGAHPLTAARQSIDLVLGGGHRILRLLGEEHYVLHEVHLPFAPVAHLAAYQRSFGAPVLVRQEKAALVISGALLRQPLPHASERLRDMVTEYLHKNFGTGRDALLERVRMAVAVSLGTSNVSLTSIAEQLAMQPRTLQRRLADAGEAFETMRDGVMRDTALKYLRNSNLPLSEIAARIGLSQQSALTRSCQRWFGASPLKIRRG